MEWLSPETVAGVAFPGGLCIYLVVRMENAIKELSKNIVCNNALVRAFLVRTGVDIDVLREVE